MRILSTAAMIAAFVALGSQPVAWAQQQQQQSTRTENLSVLSGGGGNSTGGGAGGGSAPGMGVINPYQAGGFVGAGAEDVRNAMMATGAIRDGGQGTGRGQAGPGSSQFGRGSQSRRNTQGIGARRSTAEIRARLRTGFSITRPAPAQRSSTLATRFEKSSWLQPQSPMEVAIEGGTAILRGVVATEHDRVLAERVAKLEPGVRQVENLLTLAPASESPSTR